MFESKFSKLPKLLLFTIFCLVALGIAILYSAAGGSWQPWALKQLILFSLAFFCSIFIGIINVRKIYLLAYPIYFASLLLLIGVELLGHTAMGATRWLEVAGFKLQPSEPAKLSIVLMLARYFHDCSLQETRRWYYLITPIMASILPCMMIIKQPDLGTGMLTLLSASILFFVSGVDFKKILLVIVMILLALPIAWNFLHDYQKQRVEIFLNPEKDPLGSGYNLIQSKIAIGSGGFNGKGFMQGTQSHLSFLPEHQTDFIFAFLAEEFGFLGGISVILLFALLIGLIIAISVSCKSVFLKLTAQGVASIVFLHAAINISMVMGLIPVVGVPLPFISYGGTMMVSTMLGMGLVINAHINKNIRL
jgi:rod shape determining protein RodA